MKIQVFGSGCPTCKSLYEQVKEAVKQLSIAADVDYVTGQEGMKGILALGAMSSPVVAIDGKLVMTGYSPDINKLKAAIIEAIH